MRSRVSKALRSNILQVLMSRLARRKSIGATMSGMTVMTNDIACQRVCSEWVGYLRYQPTQCSPPKMTPKKAKTTIRDQRSLFVMGAKKDGT